MYWSRSRGARVLSFLVAVVAAIGPIATTPTSAQCQFDWRDGGLVPGAHSGVASLMNWDPDGAGPLQELLVVGGSFLVAGNVQRNIATWNGSGWQAFNRGLSSNVNALAMFNNELIAAGAFTSDSFTTVNRIARWNGTNWQPLATGLNDIAYAMTVFNGELIVAGQFATADGLPASRVARWNGTSWQPLGGGMNGTVYALTVFENELIAGGQFTTADGIPASRLARWNGSAWSDVGGVTSPVGMAQVLSLATFNDELIVAGFFDHAGGIAANNIARWDGTDWHPLDIGTNLTTQSLFVYQNKLIVGGEFTLAGGVPNTSRIATWDGAWLPFGSGFTGTTITGSGPFVVYQNELIVGHDMQSGEGLVKYDGTAYRAFGFGETGWVRAFTHYHDELIAAGEFAITDGGFSMRVARRAGNSWQPLGAGIRGNNSIVVTVDALTVFNDELIAGGNFSIAGGEPGNRIARWNGSVWQPIGVGFDDGRVLSLAVYDGSLYAGGTFSLSGGQPVARIARWNGASWESVAGGMSGTVPTSVMTMTLYAGELVAAGRFMVAGGASANNIARWNGSIWQPLGSGASNTVRSLAIYNDELIAAGSFPSSNIARWNGVAWQGISSNSTLGGSVNVLSSFNGKLFAGGSFSITDNGVSSSNIAQWNGAIWIAVGRGTSGTVYALASHTHELVVGGDFVTVNGTFLQNAARISSHFGTWGPACPRGDLNCDQVVTLLDLQPFLNTILDPSSQTECAQYLSDLNGDGADDGRDIAQFVGLVAIP